MVPAPRTLLSLLLQLSLPPPLCRSQEAAGNVITTSPPVGVIAQEILNRFTRVFEDADFTVEWESCYGDSSGLCPIDALGLNIIKASEKIIREINRCPYGCTFPVEMCKDWWKAVEDDVTSLRDTCSQTNNWPSPCLTFQRSLKKKLLNQSWELPVFCSIVDPGPAYERTPNCAALVQTTIANRMTLHDSGCDDPVSNYYKVQTEDWDEYSPRDKCISNLCQVYKQFVWRMKPKNLLEDFEARNYAADFYLPGCEKLVSYNFAQDACEHRKDIAGFCDCVCPLTVAPQGFSRCDDVIDGFLLFGRFGASNVTLTRECEPEFCRFSGLRRGASQCESMDMPSTQECSAMQISRIDMEQNQTTCPWLNHTGQSQHLECLDGTRCNFQTEGWDCCELRRGRGKCPPEYPVMCDTLCSGITEYCCRTEGQCTPRKCPLMLNQDLFYETPTTSTSLNIFSGATKAVEKDEGIIIRLPDGWWIWLFTLIPCCFGLLGSYMIWRVFRNMVSLVPEHFGESMELENDKYGAFTTFRPEKRQENTDPVMPRITISMPELPLNRPLGLELVELRVVRVHPWGKRNGWMVGDIIRDIAGHPVETFEELWERLQVERNRPPVRFTVERWNILPSQEEIAAAHEGGKSRSKAAIEATKEMEMDGHDSMHHEESFPRAMGANGLPGNIHGWDYEYEDDEDDLYDDYDTTDDFQFAVSTKQPFNHSTGNGYKDGKYVSRFSESFQVVTKKPEAEEDEDDEEKKALERKKAQEAKKGVNAFVGTEEKKGRSFASEAVVFSRDAWGRSVVKHLKAGEK